MSQLIQVLDSLNKIMSKESQSFAQPHHPSRINFPLHHTWPTITIKHHPLGIKIQWPLCSMRMRPQLVLPRLSPANPGVHPRRFAHMAHSTAHRIVFRYSSDRSTPRMRGHQFILIMPGYISSRELLAGGSKSSREEVEDQKQPQQVVVIARDRASEVELEPSAIQHSLRKSSRD